MKINWEVAFKGDSEATYTARIPGGYLIRHLNYPLERTSSHGKTLAEVACESMVFVPISAIAEVNQTEKKIPFEKVKAAYYQATNLQSNPADIIQRLYQELNS